MNTPILDHTTLSPRVKKLDKILFYAGNHNQPFHRFIDSTGLRVYTENLRKPPKRRAWRIANRVASVSADGAYDTERVYEAALAQGEDRAVRMLIPPGRDAQLGPRRSPALTERNRDIGSIRRLGRRAWHTRSGYSKRSLVENTKYRYKTINGLSMRSRTFHGQRVEVQLASRIFNTMTLLGMPDSYRME